MQVERRHRQVATERRECTAAIWWIARLARCHAAKRQLESCRRRRRRTDRLSTAPLPAKWNAASTRNATEAI